MFLLLKEMKSLLKFYNLRELRGKRVIFSLHLIQFDKSNIPEEDEGEEEQQTHRD